MSEVTFRDCKAFQQFQLIELTPLGHPGDSSFLSCLHGVLSKNYNTYSSFMIALCVTDHSNEHIRGRWSGIELPAAY